MLKSTFSIDLTTFRFEIKIWINVVFVVNSHGSGVDCKRVMCEIGFGDVLPNWHQTMFPVKHRDGRWHRGAGLGVCQKRESVCRKARKTAC